MRTLLHRLGKMNARSFENLVYDVLVRRGLTNCVWRTPGADGGRDIEGEYSVVDMSGVTRLERWYVECKRYKSSVDWPTVREKIAYAENHAADYLLICTTSTLSPPCRNEIAVRERRAQRPIVRAWEGHDLYNLVANDAVVLGKYNLVASPQYSHETALPLLWASAKSIQDVYGHETLAGDARPSLELAASLAELAVVTVNAIETRQPLQPTFLSGRDLYPWCDLEAPASIDLFSSYGLRAVLCAIRLFTSASRIRVQSATASNLKITPAPATSRSLAEVLNAISLAVNFEWSIDDSALILTVRED